MSLIGFNMSAFGDNCLILIKNEQDEARGGLRGECILVMIMIIILNEIERK